MIEDAEGNGGTELTAAATAAAVAAQLIGALVRVVGGLGLAATFGFQHYG